MCPEGGRERLMHLQRRWSGMSDHISSRFLHTGFPASRLRLFLNTNTSNSNPIKPDISGIINQEAAIRRERSNPSPVVFAAILKVFIVVALAFGTRRLAFGITVSAFLLLVLEYVGSGSYSRLQLVFRSCFMLGYKSVTSLGFETDRSLEYDPNVSNKLFETSDDSSVGTYTTTSGEIDMVNEDGSHVDDLKVERRSLMDEMMSGWDEDLTHAGTMESSGIKKRRSGRAILKSKIIHKLVPKKLRRSKKCKEREGKFEDCSAFAMEKEGDGSISNFSTRQVSVNGEMETEREECKSVHFQLGRAKVDDRKHSDDLSWASHHSLDHDADCVIFGSGHSYELVKRCGIQNKLVTPNIQIDGRGKSGYIMLVVIVLVGLVGGRILSFLLAVGYCFILKYICTLRRKDSSIPVFTSSVQR